jgi:PIN domain nuclease of toxin-antitoxin system
MILLDTHALLWWALDPAQLSPRAVEVLDDVERRGGFASSISIWELGVKAQRGKLELGTSIEKLTHRIERHSAVELLPVDTATWLASLALEWDHRDPADRVIVATAVMHGLSILTKDDVIRRYPGVTSVW